MHGVQYFVLCVRSFVVGTRVFSRGDGGLILEGSHGQIYGHGSEMGEGGCLYGGAAVRELSFVNMWICMYTRAVVKKKKKLISFRPTEGCPDTLYFTFAIYISAPSQRVYVSYTGTAVCRRVCLRADYYIHRIINSLEAM